MKGVAVIGITILLVWVVVAPLNQAIVTKKLNIIVSNGNILYVGGSGPGNFSKIQDAIDNATNGDTIFVFDDSSPYYEHIIIDKSINLIGEKRHSTIIDGNEIGIVVDIVADGVNISRFTIQKAGFSSDGAMKLCSNHSTISENNIISNDWSGLVLYYSNDNTILGNTIKSNKWGGIHLGFCSGNRIIKNTIFSNKIYGVNLYCSKNNIISDNTFSINEFGINIGVSSDNNKITGNNVILNKYGIRIKESNKNIVFGNSICWNLYGFSLLFSNLTIIKNNNLIGNIVQAFFEYYTPDDYFTNCWDGNFWNRPRILPKFILGWLYDYTMWWRDPYIQFDKKPIIKPYKIRG